MKTSLTKLKSSLIVVLALTALPLMAKPVAQVSEISGQVFMITPEGNTSTLRLNDHIDEKSEIMVEEGATVTLNDYYDATYHLVGGTHLKLFNKSVQLKRGKTWIQSLSPRHSLALTTANGHVDFWKGEFITTFDQLTSRSQILVVNGDVEVSNVLDRNMKYTISAGSFSTIDPEIEGGLPRSPTKVGLASLNSALSEFKKLPQGLRNEGPSRVIASVNEAPEQVKKGKIIFISTNRLPASVAGKAHSFYKKSVAKKTKRSDLAHAPIRFYGVATNEKAAAVPRKPASIARPEVTRSTSSDLNLDPEFSQSLKKEVTQQPKYSKELESLIKDLKSF
jgi:hypothetical protein